MNCAICTNIPSKILGRFIAKADFEQAENFSAKMVASDAWEAVTADTAFESAYRCKECGAKFQLIMPDPPMCGGLFRRSTSKQRLEELRAKGLSNK